MYNDVDFSAVYIFNPLWVFSFFFSRGECCINRLDYHFLAGTYEI